MLKKKKYILSIFQNITQIVKNKLLKISNVEKRKRSKTLATRAKSEGWKVESEGQ